MIKKFDKYNLDRVGQKLYDNFKELNLSEDELWEAIKAAWEMEMLAKGNTIQE